MKRKKIFVYLSLSLLFLLAQQISGFAQYITILPANTRTDKLDIKINKADTITFLRSYPANATLKSFELQLVLSKASTVNQILRIKLKGKQIGYKNISSKAQAGSIVRIPLNFESVYQSPLPLTLVLTIESSQTNANAIFWGEQRAEVNKMPRLIAGYTNANLFSANWSHLKADPQQSNHLITRFDGADPYSMKIDRSSAISNIQTSPVLYKDRIFIQNAINSSYQIQEIDALTGKMKALTGDTLRKAVASPAVTESGILYYPSARGLEIIDLEQKKNIAAVKLDDEIKLSPLIGKDGSLYVVTSKNFIYAYSPFPEHRLLWQFAANTPGMALGNNGRLLYLFDADSSRVFALSTEDGSQRFQSAKIKSDSLVKGMRIPVVDTEDQVYISVPGRQADSLFIYDKNLRKTFQSGVKGLSQVTCLAGGKSFVIHDSSLYSIQGGKENLMANLPDAEGIFSLVSDGSGNAYMMNNKNTFYTWYHDQLHIEKDQNMPRLNFGLALANNGVLYAASDNALYSFYPKTFVSDYSLKAEDRDRSTVTFRANQLTVPENFILSNQKLLMSYGPVTFGLNTSIDKSAQISVQSSGTVSFKPGLIIKSGASFSVKTTKNQTN